MGESEDTATNRTGEEGAAFDLDSAVAGFAEKGLAKYLEDVDLASNLVDWLYEETKVNKAALRVAVKLLASLVSPMARKGSGWLGEIAKQRIEAALHKLPFYDRLLETLDSLAFRLDGELAAKREFKEIIAGRRPPHDAAFAGQLTLDLQAQIAALEKLDELGRQVADGFTKIEGLLNPQPPLRLRILGAEEENRFFYGAQRVPLFGRDQELEQLADFLYTNERFAWWLVAGSGGLGKSRLALELCLRHGMAWRTGFLPPQHGFTNWDGWEPEQPTLLIADYAAGRPDELRNIILAQSEPHDLAAPVRLLILERDADGPWWSTFEGVGGDRHVVGAARYREPLLLGSLDDDALWRVIEFLVSDSARAVPDRAVTLANLAEIDSAGRPLFAAFLADALSNDRDPRQWDQTTLIKDVLDRDKENHWKPAGVTEKDEHLLALATMAGGIEVAALASLDHDGFLPSAEEFRPDHYRAMAGGTPERLLAPLEPDLLGELFVLESLKPEHDLDTARAETLRRNVWNVSPIGMAAFLSRAAMDYPTHTTIHLLDRPAPEKPITRLFWSMATINLITHYGTAGDIDAARELYDALAALAADHPDEPALREHQASGTVNLIVEYGNADDIDAAREIYDAFAALAVEHPDEPILREEQAKGTVNLIIKYGNDGDIDAAREVYDALAALAVEHPDEPALREAQARGAVNFIAHHGTPDDIVAARQIYDALAALAAEHPDEPALRKEQARGAFNLIAHSGIVGDIDAVRRLYDALAALAAEHPDEPALREHQANGALNLIAYSGTAGDIDAARRLYDALAVLAAEHPDEPALREQQAKGAFNLITLYDTAGDVDAARRLYDALSTVAAEHPDEPALREEQARGAFNLIAGYGDAGDIDAARQIYDTLAALAAKHPDEPALREVQAKGAFNLTVDYATAGDVDSTRELYDALATLAAEHPDEPALREEQAKGAVNLIVAYRDSGNPTAVKKFLESIAKTPELWKEVQAILDGSKSRNNDPGEAED